MIGQPIAVSALRLAFAARRKKLSPGKTGLPVETVAIASTSGILLAGWFLPGEAGRGAVVLLHGVTDNRMNMVERMRFLSQEGFATLAIDFQGKRHEDTLACLSHQQLRASFEARGHPELAQSFDDGRNVAPSLTGEGRSSETAPLGVENRAAGSVDAMG